MIWLRRIAFVGAVAFLILTFVNASWIAADTPGHVRLIANGGIAQQYLPGGRKSPCPATQILPPIHDILEDTERAVLMAQRMGADMVAVDLARTADNALVLFPDATLDCRTNGKGPVAGATLAQLRALDLGYGYTADKGATFPLRGKGVGLATTLEQAIDLNPRARFLFRLSTPDAATAGLLVQQLKAMGRDPGATGDAFTGKDEAVSAFRAAFPKAWAWTDEGAQSCTGSYRLMGWTGLTPGACQSGTLVAPLDGTFTLWGWPNRLQGRITAVGGQVLATRDGNGAGLRHAADLPLIPVSYHGHVMVDDFWTVGPALRPSLDARTNEEAIAAQNRDEQGE